MPLTLTLSPQAPDIQPPHDVHPAIEQAGSVSPPVTVINNATQNVIIYVRVFQTAGPPVDWTPTLILPITSYSVPPATNATKLWVGFAYVNAYASSADYFAAHPVDASGAHHTVEIPQ
jgi:hypothetical protein